MSIARFTKARCPELAEFLESCCVAPLAFEGEHPNYHSYLNHIHLWALEWWADHHDWIDLDYRVAFVDQIFQRWRGRLTGLEPYRQDGYRLYLYESLAPTISVVAETPYGFAYDSQGATFVGSTREIMSLYTDRSWSSNFECEPWDVSHDTLLALVEKNRGSIGKPTAQSLGLQTGKLRILIEQMGLDREVNAIRKRYKRRPAAFRTEEDLPHHYQVYELILPAGYR